MHDELKKYVIESNKRELEDRVNISSLELIQKELSSLQNNETIALTKKPNLDLKRHVSKKLNKLHKRTQRVIVELLREKISNEN